MSISLNLITGHNVTTIDNPKTENKTFGEVYNMYNTDGKDGLNTEELTTFLDENTEITSKTLGIFETKMPSNIAAELLMSPLLTLNSDDDKDNVSLEEMEKFTGYSYEELSEMDLDSAIEALVASSGCMAE